MKLESIRLHNFLSHEDTFLDLKAIDAAVFLGPNGSGKSSSIIESLRWAWFGMSRYPNIADIIRTGQTETQVEHIFSLYDKRYRVLRKHSIKTKKGKSELEFAIQRNGKWDPKDLTGENIDTTEKNIRELLKMNYKTFLASMVALEGSGGYFAQNDPAERKRLLYAMLDLDRYQLLVKKANDKASKIDLEAIQKELESLKESIAGKQELEEKLFSLKISLEQLEDNLKESQPQFQSLREEKVRLETKHQESSTRIKKLKENLELLETDRESIKKQIIAQENLLNQETEIRQAVQKQKEYEESLKQLQSDLEEQNTGLSILQKNQKAYQDNKSVHMNGLLKVRAEKSEIEKKQGVINTQIANAEKQSAILTEIPCPKKFQAICPGIAQAREAQNTLSFLKEKQKQIDQNLPLLMEKERGLIGLINSTDKCISENQGLIDKKEKVCEGFQPKVKALRDLIASTAKKAALITQIETALSKKEMFEKQSEKILIDAQKIQQELGTIGEDMKKHLPKMQKIQHDIAQTEAEINEKEELRENYRENRSRLQASLEQIKTYEKKIKKLANEFEALAKEKNLYIILTNAFKTIPILILEHAKPIIEQEANRILTMISDTGMRISLPLFKVLKTSDKIVETLDIKVQDYIGERSYQGFSSGERVRLDLALRIGLSRLLMLRSGTRIGTLILDEGFGPLDQEGIESFKECLRELQRQKEFELLIAVTHIDSLKDIFPVHAMFSKNNGISHMEIFN